MGQNRMHATLTIYRRTEKAKMFSPAPATCHAALLLAASIAKILGFTSTQSSATSAPPARYRTRDRFQCPCGFAEGWNPVPCSRLEEL